MTHDLPRRIPGAASPLPTDEAALDPSVIVTLGRHSLRRYLPDGRISAVHGSLHRGRGRWVFPMYHPAAALHQASLRDTLFQDMRGLPAALLRAREAIEAERAASVQDDTHANTQRLAPAQTGQPSGATAPDDEQQLTLF